MIRLPQQTAKVHGLHQKGMSISGLVVEYIVAIDVTRVRFPADALFECLIFVLRRRTINKARILTLASKCPVRARDSDNDHTQRFAGRVLLDFQSLFFVDLELETYFGKFPT